MQQTQQYQIVFPHSNMFPQNCAIFREFLQLILIKVKYAYVIFLYTAITVRYKMLFHSEIGSFIAIDRTVSINRPYSFHQ